MAGYFASMGSALGMNSDQTQGAIGGAGSLAGLGLTIAGTLGASSAAAQEAQISGQEAQTEMQQDKLRQQMMTVDVNRKMIQAQRNAQQAQSVSKAAAVNQGGGGGLQGSGYAGGRAQEVAQGAYNIGNLNTDLQFGNQMFGLTQQLDQEKIAMAQAQSSAATSQGLASIGGAIAGQAANFAKLALL